MEKRSLTFWEIVLAVVIGLQFFDWIRNLKSDASFMAWFVPVFWIGVIAYMIGGVIVQQRMERQRNKGMNDNLLKTAKSNGFESWAEYMVVHGTDEYVRKSYEKKADEERQKREARSRNVE